MSRQIYPRWLRMFAPYEIRRYLRSALEMMERQPANFRFWVVVYIFSGIYSGLFGPYIGMFPRALGATAAQIGLITAVASAAAWIPQLLGGFLSDRYGRRWLLAGGWIFEAGMCLVSYFARDWTWLLVSGIIASLGAFGGSASAAFFAESLNDKDRAKGTSMLATIAAIPVIALPPVGAALITKLGGVQNADALRIYFLLSLVRIVVIFAYFATKTTETLEVRREVSRGSNILAQLAGDLRELIAIKRVRMYLGYTLIASFSGQLVGPFQAIMVYEIIGATPVFIGFLTSMSSIIAYIAMNIGAVWSDRIGRKKPIILASAFSGAGWIFFLIARDQSMLVPFYVLTSVAALSGGAGSALAMEYVPSRMRGRWYGTLSFVSLIPGLFAPILGGWLFDTFSPRTPYYIFYFLSFAVIVPYFLKYIPETMDANNNHAGQDVQAKQA